MANGKLRQLERKNKIPKLCDYHRENKLNVDEEYKRRWTVWKSYIEDF